MALEMKYFVLNPEGFSDHAKASRAAMTAYADAIRDADPELSEQLKEWVWRMKSAAEDNGKRLQPLSKSSLMDLCSALQKKIDTLSAEDPLEREKTWALVKAQEHQMEALNSLINDLKHENELLVMQVEELQRTLREQRGSEGACSEKTLL